MNNVQPKRLFNIYGYRFNTGFAGNVWDKECISPAIMTMGGGNREPMIIEYARYMSEFITIVGNKQRNPHRGPVDGISPTITAACGNGGGMTPMLTDATISETKTDIFMEQMRGHEINLPEELQGKKFRIRKLTPRECFRLMGVDDADIDKIQASGISNSGQYKLAGNSIVVDVLFHLFRKMFIETEPDLDNSNAKQLSLF